MTTSPRDAVDDRLETVSPVRESASPRTMLCSPIPIRQIMASLHGTDSSERVLAYSTAIADATGADISLVWVESPQEQPAAGYAVTSPLDCLSEARRQIGLHASCVRTHVVRGPKALRDCVDAEYADGTDIVVMGLGSASDASQPNDGRMAEAMIARGHAPVLLIPPTAPSPPKSLRALVTLDGSGQAEMVLFPIIALANAAMGQWIGEITLLTVCNTHETLTDATAYLEAARKSVERLVAPRIPISIEPDFGRVTTAIVGMANKTAHPRFDMLALTTQGHGHSGETSLGHVARYVLARARLPMLVVNPGRS